MLLFTSLFLLLLLPLLLMSFMWSIATNNLCLKKIVIHSNNNNGSVFLSVAFTFSTSFVGSRSSINCRRYSRTTAWWKKVTRPFSSPMMDGARWAPRWLARRRSYPRSTMPIPTPGVMVITEFALHSTRAMCKEQRNPSF